MRLVGWLVLQVSSGGGTTDDGPESLESRTSDEEVGTGAGGRFRRLQRKWELLSGRDGSGTMSPPAASAAPQSPATAATSRSRIPRPVGSPVKAAPAGSSGIPVLSPRAAPPGAAQLPRKAGTPPAAQQPPAGAGPAQRHTNNKNTPTRYVHPPECCPLTQHLEIVLTLIDVAVGRAARTIRASWWGEQ